MGGQILRSNTGCFISCSLPLSLSPLRVMFFVEPRKGPPKENLPNDAKFGREAFFFYKNEGPEQVQNKSRTTSRTSPEQLQNKSRTTFTKKNSVRNKKDTISLGGAFSDSKENSTLGQA